MEYVIALFWLTAMEIVLGIDNIIFIAILTSRLPQAQQPRARKLGLSLALVMRILLLCSLALVVRLDSAMFHLTSLGLPEFDEHINEVSPKDLILLSGGLFLMWKSVHEIHKKMEGADDQLQVADQISLKSVLIQIALMDLIFSLDSVITAVGMVDDIPVMIAAVTLAMGVMLVFAEQVSHFVAQNPTLKMLALSFLILIGVMLVAEGIGTHFDKGYIYFAMAFALGIEVLNLRVRHRTKLREARPESGA